ncbi:hypothetical protein DY000_02048072 [Brassica cretica]|uniref:Alkyl hydroperoxide reductase subunit C/ Thiol specific antioxidant domain-containing protein n=1 Tax=Brassica cretica TaxID=69181 RepID=A0ABQ7F948_BRACR|nr:hypothetical protein DY000_02048072 [Brassica cretica]
MPGITLGDTVPNLEVETTHKNFKLHYYFADSWTVLFSHPGDFTPVCTTELGAMGKYAHEFEQRGVKLLDEEAKKLFPQGFKTAELPSKKGYLRVADVS